MSGRAVRLVVMMFLVAGLAGLALATGSTQAENLANGSGKSILQACFNPVDLPGKSAERLIGPWHEPDRSPPKKLMPDALPTLYDGVPVGCIRRVSTDRRVVALTFDLCELSTKTSGYDYRIVDYLRENGIKATFFAGGKWMRSHPERTAQLLADPLFQMGNHGWTHGNLGVLKGEPAREQILWTMAQYEIIRDGLLRRPCAQALGQTEAGSIPPYMDAFRLPYGRASQDSLVMLASLGLSVIQWDVVADEGATDPDRAARAAASEVRPGSIVLMHANGVPRSTALILPRLVEMLRSKGYEFATVAELLRLGLPETHSECYFRKPGDNLGEDVKYGDGTAHPRRR